MNQALYSILLYSTDSISVMAESKSQHSSTFLPKLILKEKKGFSLQGKVVSIYNVALLTPLGFFSKSTYSQLFLYWQKEGNYYETRNRSELSADQMIELLTTVGPHSISIHFTIDNCLEVDSNVRDETFISLASETDQSFTIACVYNFFMYSTLMANLKHKSSHYKISPLPEELYQTTPLQE